jgi:hypothetical protein
MPEKKVLKTVFELKEDEIDKQKNCVIDSFVICTEDLIVYC